MEALVLQEPAVSHSVTGNQILQTLKTNEKTGLPNDEAENRRRQAGPNSLIVSREKPWWKGVVEELTEPMILLLLAVGLLYGILGELRDAVTIFCIILTVLAIEIKIESKAKGAIKELSKISAVHTPVIRNGVHSEIPAEHLVPGDIVLLRPGQRVPADLRLLETIGLRVDESALTGESVPVQKEAGAILPPEIELGDRRNLAFAGTLVTGGKGKGIVVNTGINTELGKIVGLVKEAREPKTPLQIHMSELTRWMVWIALGFSALVAVLGLLGGTSGRDTLLTGLTLAFATIPEELPILITMVLGLGAYHLSKRQAIVRRLRTAETLGSITLVATDKTGTLTENRMSIEKWFIDGQWCKHNELKNSVWGDLAVKIGALANDGIVAEDDGKIVFEGDPTDTVFLYEAEFLGYDVTALRNEFQLTSQFPLDEIRKRLSVTAQKEGHPFVMCKGAPEQVLQISNRAVWNGQIGILDESMRSLLGKEVDSLAAEGYRVLGLAFNEVEPGSKLLREQAEDNLVFVGLAALLDPPRPEVPQAVEILRRAGVRVLMITGDHPGTARTVGARVGLDASQVLLGRDIEAMSDEELGRRLRKVSICARTTPEHKLRIVRTLQKQGELVAVTGDGVNDGPALKEAAVGIAMGKTGTDVARESADMVLADDNFATVTVAVKEGRKLFANLYKAVRYYLAAKVALITSILLAVVAGLSIPFAPIQIIVMELFMDLGASTGFTAEPPEGDVMKLRQRSPGQRFMDRGMLFGIFSGGLSLGLAVMAAYLWALTAGMATVRARTVAFATWMLGHLILALLMRSEREPLLQLGIFTNRIMLLWIAAASVFIVLAVNVPYVMELLHLEPLRLADWTTVIICALLAPLWIEVVKWIRWRKKLPQM